MKRIGLNLTTLPLPQTPLFPDLVDQLVQECIDSKVRINKISKDSADKRYKHCHMVLQGLYQVWCCMSPSARLNVFLSPQYYHTSKLGKINHLSQYFIRETIDALYKLGWTEVQEGHRLNVDETLPTRLHATGELLDYFNKKGLIWTSYSVPLESVVLKDYDRENKESFQVRVPKTPIVRKMNANLRKINEHLNQQAICLHLRNDNLKRLTARMSQPKYRSEWHRTYPEEYGKLLNFNQRLLRRIFARGKLDHGGRFYGGWWQFIPSEFRPYITINGLATTEIDFSELHPRLLYAKVNKPPPEGDLYDIGLHPNGQEYDKTKEPYTTQRRIVKEAFNALLNDESGRYQTDKKDLKILGITYKELKNLIVKRHPPLKDHIGKGVGLTFQFIDSQIAERVMLKLIDKGITCLPVHDSFIVSNLQLNELKEAMDKAFSEVISGSVAKLKPPTIFESDFRMEFLPNGDLNRDALYKMHGEALHNKYVQSRRVNG